MNEPRQKRPLRDFIHRFLVSTFAVLIAVNLVEDITYKTWEQLLLASLVLGALNAFVRPLLLLGCLPLLILSLGLFLLVINAALLWLTGYLVEDFNVPGFWPAFWGALVISIVTIIVNRITGGGDPKLSFQRVRPADGRSTQPRLDDDDDDKGPVIDV
jgi:putative membrane protein